MGAEGETTKHVKPRPYQDLLRDKGKGVKWAKMLKDGQVDEPTLEGWNACKTREQKTAFINAILQKEETETGLVRYKFQPDSRWVQDSFAFT